MEEKALFNEQSVLSKWVSDMYDQYETETNDVEFLLSVIGQSPKKVLEIACGSGRILVPMAKAGHKVTGLDFDECMLSKIAPKAKGMDNISWRKADVIHENWGAEFDIVVLAGNILFNIISDMEYQKVQQLLVQKAADALTSGGSLYIDYGYTMHPETWFNDPGERVIWEGTDNEGSIGRMILLESTFDKESGICTFTRRFELTSKDGEMIRQDIPTVKHFATLEQIHNWLNSAGLFVAEEYGSYSHEPISKNTDRAIIWAKKTMQ